MQWSGVTRVGMLAPTLYIRVGRDLLVRKSLVLAIMAHLCHACGHGFEQQVPRHSLSGKAVSRSFAVCLLFCAVIMVIKERKALTLYAPRIVTILMWLLKNVKRVCRNSCKNYKLGYYSVPRPFPPCERGSNARLRVYTGETST